MTQSTQTISPLRQHMIDDMRLRKLAPKTQTGCMRAVRQLAGFLGRSPDSATAEELLSLTPITPKRTVKLCGAPDRDRPTAAGQVPSG